MISVNEKIKKKEFAISIAATGLEKVKLRQQIDKLTAQKNKLGDQIKQLVGMTEKLNAFSFMSEPAKEKVIVHTTEEVKTVLEQNKVAVADDAVIDAAEKAIDEQQPEHELTAETIDNYFDYNLNAKINEQMKKAVLDSKGTDHTDHMKYDEINRAQAEYLFSVKKKAGLEFAVFYAIPNTKNKVKKEVKGVYTLAYRNSYGKRIKDALLEFENKLEQQSEQNPVQEPTQKGSSQAADAGKQSDLVKFTGLSGTHIQALKESNIHFWVKREPDNSFSAYFHRPDVEQAKGVLSSVSQAQKKTASQSRQQTKPKR